MKKKPSLLKVVLYLAATVLFMMYLFNPADIIPDTITGFGFLDDAIALLIGVWIIKKAIKTFKLGGKK